MLSPVTGIQSLEMRRIAAESTGSFSPATIAQATELLAELERRCLLPSVGRGYWETFCFSWRDQAVEIEVFADHVELYRFFDRRTDIEQFAHTLGEPFPEALLALLPAKAAPTGANASEP
jgi:hypothetical protein